MKTRKFILCALALGLAVSAMPAMTPAPPTRYVLRSDSLIKAPPVIRLRPGESALVPIVAREKWNGTGIAARKGQQYEFTVLPGQKWNDAWVSTDADGRSPLYYRFYLSLFNPLKRCQAAPWFSLIGSIGQEPGQGFLIGAHREVTMTGEGMLNCYANDVPGFYGNNSGVLWTLIKRVR